MSRSEADIMDAGLGAKDRETDREGPDIPGCPQNHGAQSERDGHIHTPEPPQAGGACVLDSEHSLTGDTSASEKAHLLPHQQTKPPCTAGQGEESVHLPQPKTTPTGCGEADGTTPKSQVRPHNGGGPTGAPPIRSPPGVTRGGQRGCSGHISPRSSAYSGHMTRLASTSTTKSQHSFKSTAAQIQQAAGDDLCMSMLLACLWCRLWDCMFLTSEACELCVSSLCSSLCSSPLCCCCPALLRPLLEGAGESPCGWLGCCLEAQCCGCQCDCSLWDACLQTTECLELGMEISQLLFH
ncbi:myoD family inhibitor-like isoform X1 [Lepisosteus oculatus]|uniref:myoD family inhibitor-like isoform X1 n=1 Tax=Lepisosteus oculatus TaxID=7918 RepID=UPI0035F5036C